MVEGEGFFFHVSSLIASKAYKAMEKKKINMLNGLMIYVNYVRGYDRSEQQQL